VRHSGPPQTEVLANLGRPHQLWLPHPQIGGARAVCERGCYKSFFQQCPHRGFPIEGSAAGINMCPDLRRWPRALSPIEGFVAVEHQASPHRHRLAAATPLLVRGTAQSLPPRSLSAARPPPDRRSSHAHIAGRAAPPNHRHSPHACTAGCLCPTREWDGGREDSSKRGLPEGTGFWEILCEIY
jgi:hypothetical protein